MLLVMLGVGLLSSTVGRAHDIPNARVDRSTQVTLTPGRIRVDYEVSLSELTLTQELRSLIGQLPGSGRSEWFEAYAAETGPMNARGFLLRVDDTEVTLRSVGHDLTVEEHPRFVFHLEAAIPKSGRLTIDDANFASSEGTCRLAVVGRGVEVSGDDLPTDVGQIAIRPRWQLSDEEETRTHRVVVAYSTGAAPPSSTVGPAERHPASPPVAQRTPALGMLLEGTGRWSLTALAGLAFGLGMIHALQPGHGKTLMLAATVADRGAWTRVVLLAAVTTLVHTGSVLLIALGLWWSETRRYGDLHAALARTSGFVLAAIGLWRLGRAAGGFPLHEMHGSRPSEAGRVGLVALGLAAGLVPCWDAVALVLLGEAIGRLELAVGLVLVFSLGLGSVLIVLGGLAARLRRAMTGDASGSAWTRRLGLLSGLALSGLGLYLLTFAP